MTADPFAELNRTLTHERAVLIEEWLRLRVQQKPRWLPTKIWQRVLGHVLVIETQTVPGNAGAARRIERIVELEKARRCLPFGFQGADAILKAEIERLQQGGMPK